MGVDSINEVEMFENTNQCIVLYFDPKYTFNNEMLK